MLAENFGFKIDRFFKYAQQGILGALICVGLCLSFYLFFGLKNGKEKSETLNLKEVSSEPIKKDYVAIGSGPLSLKSGRFSQFIPNLSQEIQILGRNSRPDISKGEVHLLIGLKSSMQQQEVVNGQTLFLECPSKEHCLKTGLHFAGQPTSVWMKPLILDKDSILMEVGMDANAEEPEEKIQFVLQDLVSERKENRQQEAPYLKRLNQAKWWGHDMLIQEYGGENYQTLSRKHKVEFSDEKNSYVCFVEKGDYLVWEDERWKEGSLSKAPSKAPLALIKAIHPHGIEMEAWDETGFHLSQIRLGPQHVSRMNYKSDNNLPSSIRLRTSSQITCILGKRRVILREGDWLLRTPSGWRNLKKMEEIEDYIQHRMRGELFVFDALEKNQDKVVLKGHLFDEMRTQVQSVEIPISREKKSKKKSS